MALLNFIKSKLDEILTPKTEIDPALKAQLEKRGMTEKITELEQPIAKEGLGTTAAKAVVSAGKFGEEKILKPALEAVKHPVEKVLKPVGAELAKEGALGYIPQFREAVGVKPEEMKVPRVIAAIKEDDKKKLAEEAISTGLSLLPAGAAIGKIKKIVKPALNLNKLNIDDEAKNVINETLDAIKPKMEAKTGAKLTNKEVKELADKSSEIMNRGAGREQTKNWESQLLKLRENIAAQAETGKVDKDFIDNLIILKSQATDIGRKLQSFAIGADPKAITAQEEIVQAVLNAGAKADEVIKAAQGVDFNDFRQASEFYRKFIEPKMSEWIDLLRYNSMLSSPLTHLVNVTSNLLNTISVAPLEKAIAGGIDFLGSKITGKERQIFAGESGQFLKGYFTNIKNGFKNFSDVMAGKKAISQLDIKNIPVATKGAKGKVATVLSYPTRLLEAADQFFTALTEAGENAALAYRKAKGGKVELQEVLAKEKAQYRLYRQDLGHESQGVILNAIDELTNKLYSLRRSENPIVSNIAKFTVPFIKTPMNIFKQGLEYSPFGFSTLWKSPQKIEQLSKAILGTGVFVGASSLLLSGRITGAEPIGDAQKQKFKQAGRQSYSIKIGDKWVSYQKLPPAFAFPFAAVATINDLAENKKADDDTISLILTGVAKYGQFLSDQSYAKGVGDLLSAVRGEKSKIAQLISNYPQQLVPFRAFGGWLSRLIDDTQRTPDTKADFIDKQIQYLMMNIPGISFKVPARIDIEGKPIKQMNITNAFSPFRISQENKKFDDFLKEYDKFSKAAKEYADEKAKKKNRFLSTYNEIKNLLEGGNYRAAKEKVDKLTDEQYEIYKDLKAADKTKKTLEGETRMYKVVEQVQELLKVGNKDEAQQIVDGLSNEEYRLYRLAKNRLGL